MNTQMMWRLLASLASTIIVLILATSPLLAEGPVDNSQYPYCCRGDRYNNRRGQNHRWFDSKTIETLDGEISSLNRKAPRRGSNFQGTHLMIKTAQETIEVHLAPTWYLAEQDFDLSPKEQIIVIGSRIDIDGKSAIIAGEIRKGDKTLVLRDENGIPMWRGSNRQQ